MAAHIIIKAVKKGKGYCLKADNGEYPEDGYIHPTKQEAYRVCAKLYPANSVWKGKKVSSGYRISL